MKTRYIQPETVIVRLNQESIIAASQDGLNREINTGNSADTSSEQEGGGYGLTKGNNIQWEDWGE